MKLTKHESEIIRRYAANNDHYYRAEAVQIYERHIAEHCKDDRNECPEMEFMIEVLSPCPDLAYRAMLRKRITEKGK